MMNSEQAVNERRTKLAERLARFAFRLQREGRYTDSFLVRDAAEAIDATAAEAVWDQLFEANNGKD